RARDIGNVTYAGVDLIRLTRIDVEPGDVETGLGELDGKRQTDVTQADDADVCLSIADAVDEGGGRSGHDVVEFSAGKSIDLTTMVGSRPETNRRGTHRCRRDRRWRQRTRGG